jgi:AmiR/NasT family two-component response regulator
MINENIEMSKAVANAKVIADLDQAQASFMEIRALQREVEEMKMADKQN